MDKEIVELLRKQNELLERMLERLTYIDESTNKDRARGFGRPGFVTVPYRGEVPGAGGGTATDLPASGGPGSRGIMGRPTSDETGYSKKQEGSS